MFLDILQYEEYQNVEKEMKDLFPTATIEKTISWGNGLMGVVLNMNCEYSKEVEQEVINTMSSIGYPKDSTNYIITDANTF